jgi:SAM-dependent methyltransferase
VATLTSLFYRLAYQFGRPRWDSGDPRPELQELADGRAPGRALDLGCGTGTNAIYLAERGWDVVGVDFVANAIESAKSKAERAGITAVFLVGDVTRLRDAGVQGPFDLMLDIGCYHGIPDPRRDAYAAEVAAVARPGTDFYLVGISDPPAAWRLLGASGATSSELRRRFAADFDLVSDTDADAGGRAPRFRRYHLVRR